MLAGLFFADRPYESTLVLTFGGIALAVGGLALFAAGIAAHGGSVTPLPRPRFPIRIVESGAYRFARHPIYGGVILLAIGFSVARASLVALVLSVAIAVFFDRKAKVEEGWLDRLAPEYAGYRVRVPRRFIPYVF